MSAFAKHIEVVLQHEGGDVHDPADPGGETKYGISKRAFPQEDIKALTKARAIQLYLTHYWGPSKAEQIPKALQLIHLDTAVNCGVVMAVRMLQRAAGVKDDGVLGPVTIDAAQRVTTQAYADQRLAYYERIITRNPKLSKFRRGWVRRVYSLIQ